MSDGFCDQQKKGCKTHLRLKDGWKNYNSPSFRSAHELVFFRQDLVFACTRLLMRLGGVGTKEERNVKTNEMNILLFASFDPSDSINIINFDRKRKLNILK